jgi:PAS domain S-box-containing protein
MRDSVIGTTSVEGYAPKEVEEFLKNDREAFANGFSHVEERILFPDGRERVLDTKKARFKNSNGEEFILGIARDVSDIKDTQERLKESELRYEIAVEGSSVGLWDFNIITEELFWSDRFKEIVGVEEAEFTGRLDEFTERLHPDDKVNTLAAFNDHLLEKTPYNVEYRFQKNDGSYVWMHARGQALWNEKGEAIRVAGSVNDISENKTSELEREALIAKLAESNEWLEQFAFVCSHDLQEPLRIVRLFSVKLQERIGDSLAADGRAQRYLDFVMDGATRAQTLIADILSYSRVDRDQERFQLVDVSGLMQDIKSNVLLSLSDKANGSLFYENLPEVVANKTQLYQLLQNLIGNGLKYQAQGVKPCVTVSVVELEKYWQFSIKDNGIGIAARYQKQIFEVFKRLHGRDEYAGTGIGLSICKKIVERHGGSISVESEEGQGSTFYFTLVKSHAISVLEEASDVSG